MNKRLGNPIKWDLDIAKEHPYSRILLFTRTRKMRMTPIVLGHELRGPDEKLNIGSHHHFLRHIVVPPLYIDEYLTTQEGKP